MLSASRGPSRMSRAQSISSLQLLADDIICGKPVSSVDKSIHPKLVPFFQEAKTKAIMQRNKHLELKINRIMKILTLTPHEPPKTKKAPIIRDYFAYKKSKNENSDVENCSDLVDDLLNGTIKIDEIEQSVIPSICSCIKERRAEAAENRDYLTANKLQSEYQNITIYYRNIPKLPKNYGVVEYIDHLKEMYHDAVNRKNEQKMFFEDQLNNLNKCQNKAGLAVFSEFSTYTAELEEKEEQLKKYSGYQPSRRLVEMEKIERKMSKVLMFDDAEEMRRKSRELRKFEKKEFQKLGMINIKNKTIDNDYQKAKRYQTVDEFWEGKKTNVHLKYVKAMALANDEIKSIALKIQQLGGDLPNDPALSSMCAASIRRQQMEYFSDHDLNFDNRKEPTIEIHNLDSVSTISDADSASLRTKSAAHSSVQPKVGTPPKEKKKKKKTLKPAQSTAFKPLSEYPIDMVQIRSINSLTNVGKIISMDSDQTRNSNNNKDNQGNDDNKNDNKDINNKDKNDNSLDRGAEAPIIKSKVKTNSNLSENQSIDQNSVLSEDSQNSNQFCFEPSVETKSYASSLQSNEQIVKVENDEKAMLSNGGSSSRSYVSRFSRSSNQNKMQLKIRQNSKNSSGKPNETSSEKKQVSDSKQENNILDNKPDSEIKTKSVTSTQEPPTNSKPSIANTTQSSSSKSVFESKISEDNLQTQKSNSYNKQDEIYQNPQTFSNSNSNQGKLISETKSDKSISSPYISAENKEVPATSVDIINISHQAQSKHQPDTLQENKEPFDNLSTGNEEKVSKNDISNNITDSDFFSTLMSSDSIELKRQNERNNLSYKRYLTQEKGQPQAKRVRLCYDEFLRPKVQPKTETVLSSTPASDLLSKTNDESYSKSYNSINSFHYNDEEEEEEEEEEGEEEEEFSGGNENDLNEEEENSFDHEISTKRDQSDQLEYSYNSKANTYYSYASHHFGEYSDSYIEE